MKGQVPRPSVGVKIRWLVIDAVSFPGGSLVKNLPANAGDAVSILGLGRSPGVGNGNPLQNSYLESPTDRGAWQATVHGFAKESETTARPNSSNNRACMNVNLLLHPSGSSFISKIEGPPLLVCLGEPF